MSYIPDYRGDIDKLTNDDKAYMLGYHHAMEDAENNLINALISEDDVPEDFPIYNECSEIETMCAIVESGRYDGVEFTDSNDVKFGK